jgi:HNH endonuclease/NUMOD3 motif
MKSTLSKIAEMQNSPLFCKCGCGQELVIQRPDRIPSYKRGHNINKSLGKHHSQETKEKMSKAQWREKHWNWKGGIKNDKRGYICILLPEHPRARDGYVFEHIVIMEKYLGRNITKLEDVHHINGIKNDNRIENLILIPHAEHTRLHNTIRITERNR